MAHVSQTADWHPPKLYDSLPLPALLHVCYSAKWGIQEYCADVGYTELIPNTVIYSPTTTTHSHKRMPPESQHLQRPERSVYNHPFGEMPMIVQST